MASRCCQALPPPRSLAFTLSCLRSIVRQHHVQAPYLLKPPQQRSYATAKGKIRSIPRSTPPPVPSRIPARTVSQPRLHKSSTPTAATPTPPPNTYSPAATAYASTLAAKPSPTLLYLAPTSNTYMLTCYALSGFCIAYGAYNFYDQIIAPQRPDSGLWWPIPVSIGGVSLLTAALGVRVAISARRLVKSATAVPVSGGGVVLRLEARTLLPVITGKGQVVEVPLARARMSRRVSPEQAHKPAHSTPQGFAARREEELRKKKAREYELNHLLSAPFRHFGSACGRVVTSLQRMVWSEGFVQIVVDKKQVWRLDAKSGWALDDGVALDRLIGPLGGRK